MRLRSTAGCGSIMVLLGAASAHAGSAVFVYQVTPLGGNVFQYTYSVFNNSALGPGVAIQLFDIEFDPTLYDENSLTSMTPSPLNTQWSEQFLTPVPPLPAAYDVFALAGGIPDGATVSGFAVRFTWLGQGSPGAQPFEIFDTETFDLLQSGATGTASEPSTVFLIGISLAFCALTLRIRRKRIA